MPISLPVPPPHIQALHEAQSQHKQEQAELKAKILKMAVCILIALLAVMLVGNAGLTTVVVFLAKDTAVDQSGAQPAAWTKHAMPAIPVSCRQCSRCLRCRSHHLSPHAAVRGAGKSALPVANRVQA